MTNEQLANYVSSSWVLGINIGFTLVASVVSHWHGPLAFSVKPADLVDLLSILFNSTYLMLVVAYVFRNGEKEDHGKGRHQRGQHIEKEVASSARTPACEGNAKGNQCL